MITNLEQLEQRAQIVEILGKYLELKKVGSNFKAYCPFHSEKTPSFVVNPSKGFYYCFGCGARGNVFVFLQEFKKISFLEAVEEVANFYYFPLERTTSQQQAHLEGLINLLEEFNALCKQQIHQYPKVLRYLENRGLDQEMLKDFELGFCDDVVLEQMQQKGVLAKLSIACGLFNVRGKPFVYKRISIPIRDKQGKLRGFSARRCTPESLRDKQEAKYINSKACALFYKSQLLWNYTRALPHIKEKKQIIITEGFFDVIGFVKFGYPNVVCCVGTAFSQEQLEGLMSLSKQLGALEIVFCFDKDGAGLSASARAIRLCLENFFFSVSVVRLDPKQSFKDLGDALKAGVKPPMFKTPGFIFLCKFDLHAGLSVQQKDKNYLALIKLIEDYPPFFKAQCLETLESFKPAILKRQSTLRPSKPKSKYFLEGRILRTCVEAPEFRLIALRYLSAPDFSMRAEFSALVNGDLTPLASLTDFELLKPEHWPEALKSFKRLSLLKSLKLAQNQKDFRLASLIQEKMKKL